MPDVTSLAVQVTCMLLAAIRAADDGDVIETAGRVVSTVKSTEAACELPATSKAATVTVWESSSTFEKV